jgi:ribonucleoside-diphosphate reductase alpha chain
VSQTLIGITGSRPIWNQGKLIKSVPDGIGQILLSEFGIDVEDEHTSTDDHRQKSPTIEFTAESNQIGSPECPECGSAMLMEGGCSVCRACGYSLCG